MHRCKAQHRAANGYEGGDKLRDACQSLYQALETKVNALRLIVVIPIAIHCCQLQFTDNFVILPQKPPSAIAGVRALLKDCLPGPGHGGAAAF